MCSALAPLIRMVLSLIVASTLLSGLAGTSTAGAVAFAIGIGGSACADAEPDDLADCGSDEADDTDDERAEEPILSRPCATPPAAPRSRAALPIGESGQPRRGVAEHDRPPRFASASPRDGADRRA